MQRHMFVQLLVALLVVTTAVSSMLTLVVLFSKAPPAILYSNVALPLALGALTVNFCNVLPIGVGVAATWYYTNLVADHAIDVLYAAGVSYFSVVLPALVLAVLAATLGFYLTFVEAPRGWSRVLDAIYLATHDMDPSKLEPGRFYTLNDNRLTLYFGRWLTNDEIAEVFIQERTGDGGERSISSPMGTLVKTQNATLINLSDAVVQIRNAGEQVPTIVNFNRLWIDSGLRGSEAPERKSTYLAELGLVAFAAAYSQGDHNYQREWIRELSKRLIPPILTVIYMLAGVRLALLGHGTRQEAPWKFYAACVGIIAHHAILLVAADALISLDKRLAWAVVTFVAIEMCAAIIVSFAPFQLGALRKRGEQRLRTLLIAPKTMPTEQIPYEGNAFATGGIASEINEVS